MEGIGPSIAVSGFMQTGGDFRGTFDGFHAVYSFAVFARFHELARFDDIDGESPGNRRQRRADVADGFGACGSFVRYGRARGLAAGARFNTASSATVAGAADATYAESWRGEIH